MKELSLTILITYRNLQNIPNAFEIAIISRIPINGIAIKLDPSSETISLNPIVVPLTCVSKGGNRNGGSPDVTLPVIANGIPPVVRCNM